jgi:hypothetical protein
VSKRLYRFLDKHFWYRTCLEINLFTLSHEKLGISRNYRFASSLRQQLDPALTELCEQGFIEQFSYSGKGADTRLTVVAKRGTRVISQETPRKEPQIAENLKITRSKVLEAKKIDTKKVVMSLVTRGLKERQAIKLLEGKSPDSVSRIEQIIAYYDALVSSGSHLVNRSPVGFLYRAVENYQTFSIPKRMPKVISASPLSRRTRLDIEREVTASLAKIRPHLSEHNYLKVLEHAVLERMQKEGIS